MLNGVNPDNKLKIYWWEFKQTLTYLIPYQIRDFYWKRIKTIWKPQHSRLRKASPRYWLDLDHILQDVNFEIIKSFYEEEYLNGCVDWEGSGKEAQKFTKWLEKAYKYITIERTELQKKLDASYPTKPSKKRNYDELYAQVHYYENLIEETDTKILIELVKHRRAMWS